MSPLIATLYLVLLHWHSVCPLCPEQAEPRRSPTGAGAEQGGLGAVVQLDGAVGGAAVHGAVERPALVDGGDVHVWGHGRAQLLPQLAVLAGVRTPQACNQAQRHARVAHLQQSNTAVRTESSFSQEKVLFKCTSYKDLLFTFFPLLNGP